MATKANLWHAQFLDDEGQPQAGVKVYHYEAGTTVDKDVYRDSGKTTTDTQPVQGDSAGFVSFYGDGEYRLKITTNEGILLYDLQDITIGGGATSGTATRILFYGSSGAVTEDDDLTWDSTNKRLGVGVSTNITERIVMPNNSYLAAVRATASAGESAKPLIGLNANDKIVIDRDGLGTLLPSVPITGLLYLDANGEIQALTLANGQLPIGSTGAVPVAAPLIASGSITNTLGAGSSTLSFTETPAAAAILDIVTANTTVAVDAETTLYTFSIPANTLGTNKMLRLTIKITNFTNDADARTCTFRLKYGATTIAATISPTTFTPAAGGGGYIIATLCADAATNTQVGDIRHVLDDGAGTGASTEHAVDFGTAAEDSTTALDLVVSVDWGGAITTTTLTLGYAILERLQL